MRQAYNTLKALRPDIPEICYITGRPMFEEYNSWYLARLEITQAAGLETPAGA